jgi:2-oxoisovalerate dehydrogenase E1 component
VNSFHLHKAFLIRSVEQALLNLFSEGKISGTTHTCIGQEFSSLAIGECLEKDDYLVSNHRCHGHYISKTDDVEGLIAELMGKSSGVCAGRGGSQHLCGDHFFSNGIQGGIVPLAAGIAAILKHRKSNAISSVVIGDGTFGEGVIYESFNLASKWKLPLLIFVEDNAYAQSTSRSETLAGSITQRLKSFGIPTFQGNTWEPDQLLGVTKEASAYVRQNQGPAMVHIKTYRLCAHSKSDDARDISEVDQYIKKDILTLKLLEKDSDLENACFEIDNRIKKAISSAECDNVQLFTPPYNKAPSYSFEEDPRATSQQEQIYIGIKNILASHPDAYLLGEDICAPYGGAFKITKDLSLLFEKRVINTPISEAGIMGIANGMALVGGFPIVEIMFGDFLTLCMDQIINHASKFKDMYNEKVKPALIIRTPMGGGRRYGPTHSQNLEKHFLGIPNTTVYQLHHRSTPVRLYSGLGALKNGISILIENKLLYGSFPLSDIPSHYSCIFPDKLNQPTVLKPIKPADLTLVAFGRMGLLAESCLNILYQQEELFVDLILIETISPLNIDEVFTSLTKTRRLLVLEESTESFNISSEVIAQCSIKWRANTAFISSVLSPPLCSIPSSGEQEDSYYPSQTSLVEACIKLFHA